MKRIVALLLAILFSFSLAGAAPAQGELTLSSLEVDLWPEYDRPSLLVIYKADLPSQASLPAELAFRIPAAAGEPNAVAVRQGSGALFSVAYDRQVSGEWSVIRFTATTPQVQLEYYDPRLSVEGRQRHFAYQWPGDYAVEKLAIRVQQPTGAKDMRLQPDFGVGAQQPDGFVYYSSEYDSLAAGDTFTIEVDYQKDNDALSAEDLDIQPSAPVTERTAGRVSVRQLLPWMLASLGVILIVGGGWWYWRASGEGGRGRESRPRRPAPARPEEADPGEAVYCHQCGKRASPGDRFCRSCGTRLRME